MQTDHDVATSLNSNKLELKYTQWVEYIEWVELEYTQWVELEYTQWMEFKYTQWVEYT